jgi:hypothetical protein
VKIPLEHVAGALSPEGLQNCVRCGAILVDYRGTERPLENARPLAGWAEGALVYAGAPPGHATTAQPGRFTRCRGPLVSSAPPPLTLR